MEKVAEAQRRKVTCPRFHSKFVASRRWNLSFLINLPVSNVVTRKLKINFNRAGQRQPFPWRAKRRIKGEQDPEKVVLEPRTGAQTSFPSPALLREGRKGLTRCLPG